MVLKARMIAVGGVSVTCWLLLAKFAAVTWAWSSSSPLARHSSFVGVAVAVPAAQPMMKSSSGGCAGLWTMYQPNSDPPHNDGLSVPPPQQQHNAWTVLSQTERWIQTTLDGANSGASPASSSSPSSTPTVARKAISYVCEHHRDSAMILARLFRHLREERERGLAHGTTQLEAAKGTSLRWCVGESITPYSLELFSQRLPFTLSLYMVSLVTLTTNQRIPPPMHRALCDTLWSWSYLQQWNLPNPLQHLIVS
jgi:hypothetical protein